MATLLLGCLATTSPAAAEPTAPAQEATAEIAAPAPLLAGSVDGNAPLDDAKSSAATPADAEAAGALPDATASAPFSIRQATGKRQLSRRDPESGAVVMLAKPLRVLVGQAWGLHPLDVQNESALDLDQTYDVLLHPDSSKERAIQRLLQRGLARSLGFEARIEERTVPVSLLRRVDDAPPLEPSTATETSVRHKTGEIRATRVPMRELQMLARWRGQRPVVDDTGLDGLYDWVLQWDPAAGRRGFFLAYRDLGFEIVPGERPVRFVIVSQAP